MEQVVEAQKMIAEEEQRQTKLEEENLALEERVKSVIVN